MKPFFSERNIVVVLFVTVLITFSLAQEDSKKMEQQFTGGTAFAAAGKLATQIEVPASEIMPATPVK